jgi:HEAT repeat protein/3',5'-cyclic AMP phosphodiesterase CpdA
MIQEYYTAENLLKQLPSLSDDTLKREYLNYLKWTEPLALMLELVDEEAQAVRVVRLALSVDLRLGARLAGAVKPEFQAQTVSLVGRQDIPHPLKLYLFGITRSDSTISGLLEALEDENIVVRRIAAYALDKIGNEAAIPGLLKALGDENIVVRRIAAYALGQIGSEAAISGLLKALEDESYDVCWRAAQTLCKIGSEAAVSGLLRALEHEKINVRWKAAEALGEIGSEAAISGLLKSLEDERYDVRWRTAYALGQIGSEAAISGLLKALEDEDSNVRWRAAEALGQIGSEVAIPGLLKALEDKNCNVCGRAAEALGQIGSERAISGLLQILEDGDYDVHNRAIEALGKISSEATISGLLKAVEDKGFDIHWTVTDTLDKIDSDVAVSVLLKAVEHEDYCVRQIAAYALGKIETEAAILGLLKAVEDEDYHVRWIAAYALGQIGTEAAIYGLLKAVEDEDYHVRQITAYVLGQIGTGAAISGLLKPMKDESSAVHRRATYELGKIGIEAMIPGLLKALEDADPDVCRSAAEALGRIGTEAAIPGLLKALEHKDHHVRRIAAEELGKIGTETAIPSLLKALKDADPDVRWSSAEALGEIGSFKLLSPLTQHLQQTGEVDILGAISTLQKRCKFYNYTFTQAELIPSMYILHLSDLHFGTPDQAKLWSNQLAADLYNELNCPRLDALIVSGDIAKFSTPEEYHAAQQFLDNLRQEFQLQPKQVIMVPGNHDLNWGLAKQAYKLIDREDYQGELKEGHYIKVDEKVIRYRDEELYKQRFAHFSTFYETIKGEPYPLEYEQQGILYHLPEQNLLLLGLNSAWQLDYYYKSRASIHMEALTKALTQIRRNRAVYENCLKIAVWHHPLDSDGDDRITDQGFMEQLAVAGFRLFLHGHIHKAETSLYRYDMSADGRKLDRICAGTFGALTKELMPAYPWQYNLLKLEGDKLTVHTRRREKENGAWKPDARWSQGVGKPLLDYYTICLTPPAF